MAMRGKPRPQLMIVDRSVSGLRSRAGSYRARPAVARAGDGALGVWRSRAAALAAMSAIVVVVAASGCAPGCETVENEERVQP
jgi:hypothetical protein